MSKEQEYVITISVSPVFPSNSQMATPEAKQLANQSIKKQISAAMSSFSDRLINWIRDHELENQVVKVGGTTSRPSMSIICTEHVAKRIRENFLEVESIQENIDTNVLNL